MSRTTSYCVLYKRLSTWEVLVVKLSVKTPPLWLGNKGRADLDGEFKSGVHPSAFNRLSLNINKTLYIMEKEANFKDLLQEAIKRDLITLVHTDRTGVKHKIDEMSDSYLLNCIQYAIKKKKEEEFWDAVL